MDNNRTLPTYTIEGTTFIVDVVVEELRQLDQLENTISFGEMYYTKNGYEFDYNKEIKNIPAFYEREYVTINVPQMVDLDPVGMAQKYHLNIADLNGKKDIDIIVDQQQLALREAGQLPVIEIVGHPFYVDIRIDLLRPKDDWSTMGIRFSEIEDYLLDDLSCYRIPYNPTAHTFVELDYENIKAIPKGIVVVEIPNQLQLDALTFGRKHNIEIDHLLRNNPIQMQMKAREVSWDDTPIKQIIAKNLKKDLEKQQSQLLNKSKRRKGRGL